jgi:hypothetical protein
MRAGEFVRREDSPTWQFIGPAQQLGTATTALAQKFLGKENKIARKFQGIA